MWLTKTNLKSPWKVYTYMCLSDLCVFYEHKNDFQCAFCCLVLLPVNVFFFRCQTLLVCRQLSEGIGFRCHYIDKASKAVKFGPKSKKNFGEFWNWRDDGIFFFPR